MMTKQVLVYCGVAVTALFVSTLIGARISAQNLAHGIPSPEKIYGDGVTWPIKIETRDYDMAKLLAPPAMSDHALAGRILWLQKCAYCHDGVGEPTYRTMGPWLGAETVTKLGEDNVRSFIASGDVRMPAFRYSVDAEQMDDLVAFMKTIPAETKPTAAQLAGRNLAPAASD